MTNQNYSILDAQDLLNDANDIIVFMRTGIVEQLSSSCLVQDELLSLLADHVSRVSSILTVFLDKDNPCVSVKK